MKTTEAFLQSWAESRTRFSNQLNHILQADLRKRLGDSPNSAGFLIRHIADVELLFALDDKNNESDLLIVLTNTYAYLAIRHYQKRWSRGYVPGFQETRI